MFAATVMMLVGPSSADMCNCESDAFVWTVVTASSARLTSQKEFPLCELRSDDGFARDPSNLLQSVPQESH